MAENPTPQPQPKHVRRSLSLDVLNVGIMLLILAGVAFSLWKGWLAVQPPAPATVAVASTPIPSATPGTQTLKLNKTHSRVGAEVQVNTNDIGRNDPFVTP